MSVEKRRPGRPRKDPTGTQKELRHKAYQQRLMVEASDRARKEQARREVQRIVREVFAETPWFSKVVAWLFMKSAQRVSRASLDIEPKDLGGFVSEGFSEVLSEFATFKGLSRAARAGALANAPSAPGAVTMAATSDLANFVDTSLAGLLDEEDEPLASQGTLSDAEAELMGFLPDA